MAAIENPVPRAAAEAIARLVAEDPGCVEAIIDNPAVALRDLGITDDLARSLASIVAFELGQDVVGFALPSPVESIRQCINCTVSCVMTRVGDR